MIALRRVKCEPQQLRPTGSALPLSLWASDNRRGNQI
jgi:hypothetical protein